jgi:mycothiol synthase
MQLQMIWPRERLTSAPSWSVPEGYGLRTFRPGDEEKYIGVMKSAGFSDWNRTNLDHALSHCLPEGLFFVVHDETTSLVATALALHNPDTLHPFGGELGWVAADPAHRGKGLGFVVSAAATKRFLDGGYTDIYLRTDDFRLPAIKMYLKLGYVPFLHAADMEERWQAVCRELKMEFEATGSVRVWSDEGGGGEEGRL